MDNLTYNASHAKDKVAAEAIRKVDRENREKDEMPYKIKGFIDSMKRTAKDLNIKIENRIVIKDLETGRIWP